MASSDMWRYGAHARSDAIAILDMVESGVGFPRARIAYEKWDTDELAAYEDKHKELIGQFLAKTATQRPSFLRRIGKNVSEDDVAFFLVMCAQAALRVHRFFDLRDHYVRFLVPGAGYRVATHAIYEFTQEIHAIDDLTWPGDLIDEVWPGADEGWFGEDDE